MKIKEAMPIYREYRQNLIEQTKSLVKQRNAAQTKYETTGDTAWSDEAATLQLSIDTTQEEFQKNQKILDSLTEQWCAAANAESAKALSDPETGLAATFAKIMTTVRRMCHGDKVPASDERKLMEYDKDLYLEAKQAQAAMEALNKKPKEYDSLWDEEEDGQKYDPEGVADNTEAQGTLPEIPDTDTSANADGIETTGNY